MKKLFKACILTAGLLLILSSCENFSVLPSHEADASLQKPATACQAPSLAQNIIGTWHFESTYNPGNTVTTGTVTFNADRYIVDPDSLFKNRLDDARILAKSYNPEITTSPDESPGSLLEAYIITSRGTQIASFTVANNACSSIHLLLNGPDNSQSGFTLTRL